MGKTRAPKTRKEKHGEVMVWDPAKGKMVPKIIYDDKTDPKGYKVGVGTTLKFSINSATKEAIIQSIRAIDKMAFAGDPKLRNLADDDIPLVAIRDYATKPAYKTELDGTRTLVRGPLAKSLDQYLGEFIRVGKVRWESVLDENTGELDRSLDGTIWDADDPAAPIPPLHPNCRCRRVPIAGPAYK